MSVAVRSEAVTKFPEADFVLAVWALAPVNGRPIHVATGANAHRLIESQPRSERLRLSLLVSPRTFGLISHLEIEPSAKCGDQGQEDPNRIAFDCALGSNKGT